MAKYDWNPWRTHGGIAEGYERMRNGVACRHEPCGKHEVEPAADFIETRSAFVIEVELPGVKREDIVLEIHGRELSIHGKPRADKDEDGSVYHVMERCRARFSRVFVLPGGVESDQIGAAYADGVLVVTVPKKKDGKRTVPVTASE